MRRSGWAAGVLLFAVAGGAEAYVRTTDPETGMCNFWPGFGMSWLLNHNCSDDLGFADCERTVRSSFDTWNAVECSRFVFSYRGTTSRTDIGFDQEHGSNNINLVLFVESNWPHARDAIALTTTTYDKNSGELVDADLEINGVNFRFSVQDAPPAGWTDLQNTVTHEAGHMLGLDHSSNPEATMYSTAPPGDVAKRTLHQDDIDGICFVYPNSGGIPIYTDASMSRVCGKPQPGGCCATAGDISRGWLWLAAFALILRRRRKCFS